MDRYKKIISTILFIIMLLTFSGCDIKDADKEGEVASEVEFAYNLIDYDKTIQYDGSPVTVAFEIYNKEDPSEFGIMVFIGGVIQEFTTSEYSENKYMQKYSVGHSQQKNIDIKLTPQNLEKGEYELFVVIILNPSYIAEAPNYVFGYNHKISFASTKIKINQDIKENTKTDLSAYSNKITSEEKNKYKNEDGSNQLDRYTDCVIFNNGIEENRKIKLNGSNLNVDFKLLGGDSAKYYLTVFINHEPVMINEINNNALLNVNKGMYANLNFNYNSDQMENNSVIYAIAIPAELSTDNVYPIKSDSIIILK